MAKISRAGNYSVPTRAGNAQNPTARTATHERVTPDPDRADASGADETV